MSIRLLNYSYRFAEQVLNSNLLLKKEIEDVIRQSASDLSVLSRPKFNEILEKNFVAKVGKVSLMFSVKIQMPMLSSIS